MSPRSRSGSTPTLLEIEQWMIRHGQPMMLRRPRHEHPTLARTLPFVAAYVVFQAPLAVGLWALFLQGIDVLAPTGEIPLLASFAVVGLLAAGFMWAPLAFWAMIQLQRRSRRMSRRSTGHLVTAVALAVLVALDARPNLTWGQFATAVAWDVATIAVVAYLVRVGAVAVVYASVRRVRGHVRDMMRLGTRALPLLLVFVTFLFVNTENWQMSSSLKDSDLTMVVAFFLATAGLFVLVRLPEEVSRVRVEITPEAVRRATARTPLGAALADMPDEGLTGEPALLKRRERANLIGLLLARQAVQAVLMGLVVFAFFAAFGRIAIKPSVIESWVGAPPSPIELFPNLVGVALPFSLELAKVSLVLAAFSALYFTVFGVTDATYREQFFQRMLTSSERVLLIREAYLRVTDPRRTGGPDTGGPDTGGPGADGAGTDTAGTENLRTDRSDTEADPASTDERSEQPVPSER